MSRTLLKKLVSNQFSLFKSPSILTEYYPVHTLEVYKILLSKITINLMAILTRILLRQLSNRSFIPKSIKFRKNFKKKLFDFKFKNFQNHSKLHWNRLNILLWNHEFKIMIFSVKNGYHFEKKIFNRFHLSEKARFCHISNVNSSKNLN